MGKSQGNALAEKKAGAITGDEPPAEEAQNHGSTASTRQGKPPLRYMT